MIVRPSWSVGHHRPHHAILVSAPPVPGRVQSHRKLRLTGPHRRPPPPSGQLSHTPPWHITGIESPLAPPSNICPHPHAKQHLHKLHITYAFPPRMPSSASTKAARARHTLQRARALAAPQPRAQTGRAAYVLGSEPPGNFWMPSSSPSRYHLMTAFMRSCLSCAAPQCHSVTAVRHVAATAHCCWAVTRPHARACTLQARARQVGG